ncbi:hypothetical protein J1N35_013525 [Gossypium stocksii]|uniref:Reverse transcriptase n=1 Tax=Gossypium stocksii TaxID=47602 RepID=A0A9D4A8G1_9ROSI|nr:hypothetical protein J1N35_013525 [Gossypium stocksii]
MRLASQERRISGAKVCRSALPITHLMFADDCILFGEVSNREIGMLKSILEEYESCSGQCVNSEKSTVFFSSNVNDHDKNMVFQFLNVRCSTNPEQYLGLPSLAGRKKKLAFQNLKDRLKQKINNWSLRHISQGGRESIWAAKGLLLKGLGWRIGNGKHVSIWDDAWIPGNKEFRIQNSNVNMNISKVADLIDVTNRKWNSELIYNTFSMQDAEKILCIHLSSFEHDDFVIWRGEPTGEYSV